jgi:hypothetical protein
MSLRSGKLPFLAAKMSFFTIRVKDATTVVADDEKAVENAESKRGYGEEVHRGNGLAMVPQERQPALRWVWSSGRSPKPSRDRRL